MLQTQTPGGEPTQSCQEEEHVSRDGKERARELNTVSILLGAKPIPRAPSPSYTDPVCHGPQQAVQVADQRFGCGAGLLGGQAGEGTATVVEGEVAALVGRRIRGGHREGAAAMTGPVLGCRSALTMCKMRMRASLSTSAVTTWERTVSGDRTGTPLTSSVPSGLPASLDPPEAVTSHRVSGPGAEVLGRHQQSVQGGAAAAQVGPGVLHSQEQRGGARAQPAPQPPHLQLCQTRGGRR